MLDVDAAPQYLGDASVYVYDAEETFVKRIDVPREQLVADDFRVRIEDLPEGDYHFVVWSGLKGAKYVVSGDEETMDTFRLSLRDSGSGSLGKLPDLFYGSLSVDHFNSDIYAVHEVDLMKDTNELACMVVSVDENTAVDAQDFALKIVAPNSVMDVRNRLVTTDLRTYKPFYEGITTLVDTEYGQLNGAVFNVSTLRLMNDGKSRIILERRSTGETVFDISFSDYLGQIGTLYTGLGRTLSVQEYLDRQDFYTIVFFLSGDLTQLIQLQVNSWRVRAVNHLKL